MNHEEVLGLCSDLGLREAKEPFGAYLFAAGEPGAELGRHVERAVFLEAFGNTPATGRGVRSLRGKQLFICVVDQLRGIPPGVMRVVPPSPAGFKSLNDIEPVWGRPMHAHRAHRSGSRRDAHLGHRHPRGADSRAIAEGDARPHPHGPLPDAHLRRSRLRHRMVRRDLRHAGIQAAPLEAAHDLRRLRGDWSDAVPRLGGEHARRGAMSSRRSGGWPSRTRICTPSLSRGRDRAGAAPSRYHPCRSSRRQGDARLPQDGLSSTSRSR